MDTMYHLDFSRGTVEKIDASVPPRGWQGPSTETERETPPQRRGYSFGALGTPPPAKQDEE